MISAEAVARLAALEAASVAGRARVHLHHREGGHWIHAESPGVVVDLLAEWLPQSVTLVAATVTVSSRRCAAWRSSLAA